MTRNLKVLGLAITAALAMSAVWAAGSAQAADPELHCTSTTNTCTVTAPEKNAHTFTFEGVNMRCRSRLTATLNNKTVSSVSGVSAAYNECRWILSPTINMEGCTYAFNMVAASIPPTANFSIVCPAGKSININNPFLPCTITIGAQNSLAHIVFSNSGTEPTHVNANITVSGLRYTTLQNTCPGRSGTFNTGTYNGESTLEGYNDNAPSTEGTKVGLHVKPL